MRWRLQLWYGILLCTVLGGFGFTAYELERARQMRGIDEGLRERLPVLVAAQRPIATNRQWREFNPNPKERALLERASSGGFYYVVWLRHGVIPVVSSETAPKDVPMPSMGNPAVRQRGELREAYLFSGPGDCVLVGRSIGKDLMNLRQFAWLMVGAGVGVLVLGLLVGTWLIGRSLLPIQGITTAARKIATGDLTQRIGVADVESELGELARVLNSTFARLDAAFAQQARFTADAAHELRTPVTVMLSHSENGLAESCPNEEHREAFEASRRAAQRMRRLIESLLELARLDAGEATLRCDPCDLQRVVQESIELLAPLALQRGITLHTTLESSAILGDSERLGQVVANLLSNALEYNRDGGEIWISTGLNAGFGILSIANTGDGIAAEDLPHVFERFYRADRARSALVGNCGLGLSIAKAIVDSHDGSIEVSSSVRGVTTFTVKIPRRVD